MKITNLLLSTVAIIALNGCGTDETAVLIDDTPKVEINTQDKEDNTGTDTTTHGIVLKDETIIPDTTQNTASQGEAQDLSTQTGKFIDSPVSGLTYRCFGEGIVEHLTTANGEFTCKIGKQIQFKIGRTKLGNTKGGWINFDSIITPKTLFPDNIEAVKLAQVLQTLDTDGDPENGIELDVKLAKQISEMDFTSDDFTAKLESEVARLKEIIGSVNKNIEVVNYANAKKHLDKHTSDEKINSMKKAMESQRIAPTTFTTSAGTLEIPTISREMQLKYVEAVNKVRGQDQMCGKWGKKEATNLISWNTKLHNAAYAFNWDMAYGNARKHIGSATDTDVVATNLNLLEGSTAGQRIAYFNYKWSRFGENVARGYPTVEQALEGLLSSEDHCMTLMSPKYAEMGLSHMIWKDSDGSTHHYWTQDFGAIREFENPAPSYPAKIKPKLEDSYHITVYGALRCPKTKRLTDELNSKNIPYLFRDVYNYNEDRVDPDKVLMIGVTPAFHEVKKLELTYDSNNDAQIMLPVAVVKRGESIVSSDAADMKFIIDETK